MSDLVDHIKGFTTKRANGFYETEETQKKASLTAAALAAAAKGMTAAPLAAGAKALGAGVLAKGLGGAAAIKAAPVASMATAGALGTGVAANRLHKTNKARVAAETALLETNKKKGLGKYALPLAGGAAIGYGAKKLMDRKDPNDRKKIASALLDAREMNNNQQVYAGDLFDYLEPSPEEFGAIHEVALEKAASDTEVTISSMIEEGFIDGLIPGLSEYL